MKQGRALELYFVDGTPDGMMTASMFNWTGHILRIPRTRLPDGLRRPEASQTGIYILVGEDKEGPLAYIGEAENMADRLRQHSRERDWWDQAVLVTTTGDALHKAHVKFLENRLIRDARQAQAMRLENGNLPNGASLNEAATASMESFLGNLHMVLPAIRVDVFRSGRQGDTRDQAGDASRAIVAEFFLNVPRKGGQASARLVDGKFVIQAGSSVRPEWVGDRSYDTHYWKLHDKLVADGLISQSQNGGMLVEDYAFSSPSAAAAIATGRSSNGRTEWKTKDGRTYAQWEEDQISGVSS
ncbi:GIY-YIG nuclease family protein [Actibacterium sp.]|uniref:GIY-YIG nuclease family protein n=1 Tax=Actibacterium sp. TaxID=1872125 RepID=UPI0035693357